MSTGGTDFLKLRRQLRRLEKSWPRGAILICSIDSSSLVLFDKHPEDGGHPIEAFRIPTDAVTQIEEPLP